MTSPICFLLCVSQTFVIDFCADVLLAKPARSDVEQRQTELFVELIDKSAEMMCKPWMSVHRDREKYQQKYSELQQLVILPAHDHTSGMVCLREIDVCNAV